MRPAAPPRLLIGPNADLARQLESRELGGKRKSLLPRQSLSGCQQLTSIYMYLSPLTPGVLYLQLTFLKLWFSRCAGDLVVYEPTNKIPCYPSSNFLGFRSGSLRFEIATEYLER